MSDPNQTPQQEDSTEDYPEIVDVVIEEWGADNVEVTEVT